jgi:hypothetical protein
MGQKLSVELEVISNATKELNSIGHEFNNFQSKIMAFGHALSGFLVGGTVVREAIGQFKELSKEAKEYTALHGQLRESLGYTSLALDREGYALSKAFVIKEKDVAKMQQRLSLYTQDEGMINKLTAATIRYAAATGKDLLTATDMVDKAIISASGKMKGFPGTLDGASESSDRLSSVVDILNRRMHGQAEAVAASKSWWDKLKVSIENTKEQIAVGYLGSSADKEFLKYKTARDELEKFTESEDFFAENRKFTGDEEFKRFKTQYGYQLKIVEDYEKKVAAEKLAAQKASGGDDYNVRKMTSLTPGHTTEDKSDYKEYLQKKKAADKEAEQEEKKHQAFLLGYEKQYGDQGIELIEAVGIRKLEIEEQQALAEIEFMDRTESEKEMLVVGIMRRYDALKVQAKKELNNKIRDLDLDRIKSDEDREKRLQQGHLNFIIARQRAYEEYNRNLKIGSIESAQGVISSLQKIAQASHANANTMKRLEQGQAIAAGALAAVRALENPVPGLRWIDFWATVGATAGQVAIIEQQKFWKGTGGASGGLSMINERGGELVDLPRGSVVHTASETKNLTTNQNGGNSMTVHIHGQNGDVIETFNTSLRRGSSGVDRLFDLLIQGIKQRG